MAVIRFRRGTAAQWVSTNPVLAAGEPGYESDTGKVKFGNGTNVWTDLDYFLDESELRALFALKGEGGGGEGPGAVLSVNDKTGAVVLVKADIGLGNVDNTSDQAKPVSAATQIELNGKALKDHSHSYDQITGDMPVAHRMYDETNGWAERPAALQVINVNGTLEDPPLDKQGPDIWIVPKSALA